MTGPGNVQAAFPIRLLLLLLVLLRLFCALLLFIFSGPGCENLLVLFLLLHLYIRGQDEGVEVLELVREAQAGGNQVFNWVYLHLAVPVCAD